MMNIFKAMSINNDFSINSGLSITALLLHSFIYEFEQKVFINGWTDWTKASHHSRKRMFTRRSYCS